MRRRRMYNGPQVDCLCNEDRVYGLIPQVQMQTILGAMHGAESCVKWQAMGMHADLQ
jgi:hypothetical protein